jgi:hypothetical protein
MTAGGAGVQAEAATGVMRGETQVEEKPPPRAKSSQLDPTKVACNTGAQAVRTSRDDIADRQPVHPAFRVKQEPRQEARVPELQPAVEGTPMLAATEGPHRAATWEDMEQACRKDEQPRAADVHQQAAPAQDNQNAQPKEEPKDARQRRGRKKRVGDAGEEPARRSARLSGKEPA